MTATDTYTEQGGTVTDNDPDYSETATPSGDTPDTSSIGVYTVLYDAPDDAAGNTPDQQSIVITVSDTTPPTFDVDGNTDDYSTTVPFGGTYTQVRLPMHLISQELNPVQLAAKQSMSTLLENML